MGSRSPNGDFWQALEEERLRATQPEPPELQRELRRLADPRRGSRFLWGNSEQLACWRWCFFMASFLGLAKRRSKGNPVPILRQAPPRLSQISSPSISRLKAEFRVRAGHVLSEGQLLKPPKPFPSSKAGGESSSGLSHGFGAKRALPLAQFQISL